MNIEYSKLSIGIVISLLLVSGCSSLTDLTGVSLTDLTGGSLADEDDKISSRERATLNDMARQMQEWEELKPGLIRLIKQENELSFLLSEIENMSNAEPFTNTYVDTSGRSLTEQQGSVEQAPELRNLAIPTVTKNNAPSQSVEVGAVRPIQSNLANPNKFSNPSSFVQPSAPKSQFAGASPSSNAANAAARNVSAANFTSNNQQQRSSSVAQEQGASMSKFQETSVANIVGSTDECSVNANSTGDNAIHLVSYKSKSYVEKGWQELMSKHKEVLCGKQPIVASVNVKGVDYQSLRVGPYVNVAEAQSACNKLRSSGQYCAVTKFAGKNIEQL